MTEKEELIDKSKKIVMSAFDNEPIYMYAVSYTHLTLPTNSRV